MTPRTPDKIAEVVSGLDHWLESMRVDFPTPGYGGPVVHWWNHCLAYRGSGLDWRYEGIVDGYLTLWRTTADRKWLAKAVRAGDDLVAGQTPTGTFANSQFEYNPGDGGTPHEAAAAIGLLLLARELRALGEATAEGYLAAARRNLERRWFGQLWHEPTKTLWDGVGAPSFVPNKAATFVEAVMLLAEMTGDGALIERYALPTGERILAMQVCSANLLDGAIAQNRFGERVVHSYFPLYIARCVPALLALGTQTGEHRFRDAAVRAARFLERMRLPDGGLPQILYHGGRQNRWPRWIAGAGDIVRALDLAAGQGASVDAGPTLGWILRGARPDGRIAAAEGFGRLVPVVGRRDRFADELGVVGWADKAFRALAGYVGPGFASLPAPGALPTAGIEDHRVMR